LVDRARSTKRRVSLWDVDSNAGILSHLHVAGMIPLGMENRRSWQTGTLTKKEQESETYLLAYSLCAQSSPGLFVLAAVDSTQGQKRVKSVKASFVLFVVLLCDKGLAKVASSEEDLFLVIQLLLMPILNSRQRSSL